MVRREGWRSQKGEREEGKHGKRVSEMLQSARSDLQRKASPGMTGQHPGTSK